jgi:hypothetical protein
MSNKAKRAAIIATLLESVGQSFVEEEELRLDGLSYLANHVADYRAQSLAEIERLQSERVWADRSS